jgi:hypothetical protein
MKHVSGTVTELPGCSVILAAHRFTRRKTSAPSVQSSAEVIDAIPAMGKAQPWTSAGYAPFENIADVMHQVYCPETNFSPFVVMAQNAGPCEIAIYYWFDDRPSKDV